MALSSLFRLKIILPVVIAIFCTPIPTKLGVWKFLLSFAPWTFGMLPCQFPNGQDDWGFTFEDLYGGGNGDGDGKPSEREKRQYRNRLWGQTALVTGANSGTGYEISLALARLGVRVTMACRNPKRCEAARQKILEDERVISRGEDDRGLDDLAAYITTMTVDTSSLASVKKFSGEFLEQLAGDPLDMLYLNAGIGPRPLKADGTNELSVDGIEMVFATNVVGHHLMHKLLEPAIAANTEGWNSRKTPARIVQTSSCASYEVTLYGYSLATDLERLNGDPQVDMSHYSQSKLAQILWARELTVRLDAANNNNNNASSDDPNAVVYANSAHPGAVATNIWMTSISANARDGGGIISRAIIAIITFLTKGLMSCMWTSEEGALTLVYLGTAVEDLQQQAIRGKYFHPQSQLVTVHNNVYENETETNILQAKLWQFLDDLVADFV